MKSFYSRIASAPISWGICEVPGWGKMLPTDRVLSEMNNLGLPATELGAPGFLPSDANEISEKLGEFEMSLIGGFTPVVVHDKNQNQETLSQVKKVAELFKKTGATHLVSSRFIAGDGMLLSRYQQMNIKTCLVCFLRLIKFVKIMA